MVRLILSALCSLCLCGSTLAADKPNVVLIVIDDLGQRDLGCYGSTFYQTPNIDRMAKEGLRFTDFYAACPVCSPTRASILTGRYPQRMGITDWIPGRKDLPDQRLKRPEIRNELPLEEVTIAEALKKQGYTTAIMGKWHLGGKGFEPEKQGFDINIAGDQTGTPRSYFAPFENKLGKMPGLEKAEPGEYLTDRLATEAEKFIEATQGQAVLPLPAALRGPHAAAGQAGDHRQVPGEAEGGNAVEPGLRGDGGEHGRGGGPRAEEARRPEALGQHPRHLHQRQRRPGHHRGRPHRRDLQRPAARGEGVPLRGRDSRRVHHEVAGKDQAGDGDG